MRIDESSFIVLENYCPNRAAGEFSASNGFGGKDKTEDGKSKTMFGMTQHLTEAHELNESTLE